jgi:hypothetical protein
MRQWVCIEKHFIDRYQLFDSALLESWSLKLSIFSTRVMSVSGYFLYLG